MLKKGLLILNALFILHLSAWAQTVKFGAKAGINFANISAYSNPTNSVYQSKNYGNTKIGALAELEWTKITLQTGLMFDGKGGQSTYIDPASSTNRRKNTRLYYLEVPVNLLYQQRTKIGTLLFGGGPYVAYGVGGNYSLSGIIYDSQVSGNEQIQFGNNENSDYKRTDYGLNLRTEIRLLHGIGFELNYEFGLRNIASPGIYDSPDVKTRNKVFGVAVSYLFKNN